MSHVRYERLQTTNNNYNNLQDDSEEIELGSTRHNGDSHLNFGGADDAGEAGIDFDDDDFRDDFDDEDDGYAGYGKRNSNKYQHNHVLGTSGQAQKENGQNSAARVATKAASGSRIMHMAVGTLAAILLYLTLSISLTFYQNSLVKKLRMPITIVCYHLVIKLLLAGCVRSIYKWRKGKSRVQLDWRTSLRKMAPTGIASGIDIGFSNWGMEFVPISLYTMTKSSTIVFILFFAILLGLEKKSWSLVFIVGLIATGLFMFTYKSTQFDAVGFIFILVASLSSGVRWSFAQFVMQKSKLGLHNPIDMIFHMQPWMIASLLPFLVGFEGQKIYDVLRELNEVPTAEIVWLMIKVSIGAFLAFLMEVSEFLVLLRTSSLTLSIAGIFKDLCQLALAVEFNNDQLSLTNVLGLVVCLAGISLHLLHKYSAMAKANNLQALDNDDDSHDYQYNENNVHTANSKLTTANNAAMNETTTVSSDSTNKKHSALTVPLLEQTDSDDSGNDPEDQNASDVIFDVLKRRDMQR